MFLLENTYSASNAVAAVVDVVSVEPVVDDPLNSFALTLVLRQLSTAPQEASRLNV